MPFLMTTMSHAIFSGPPGPAMRTTDVWSSGSVWTPCFSIQDRPRMTSKWDSSESMTVWFACFVPTLVATQREDQLRASKKGQMQVCQLTLWAIDRD